MMFLFILQQFDLLDFNSDPDFKHILQRQIPFFFCCANEIYLWKEKLSVL